MVIEKIWHGRGKNLRWKKVLCSPEKIFILSQKQWHKFSSNLLFLHAPLGTPYIHNLKCISITLWCINTLTYLSERTSCIIFNVKSSISVTGAIMQHTFSSARTQQTRPHCCTKAQRPKVLKTEVWNSEHPKKFFIADFNTMHNYRSENRCSTSLKAYLPSCINRSVVVVFRLDQIRFNFIVSVQSSNTDPRKCYHLTRSANSNTFYEVEKVGLHTNSLQICKEKCTWLYKYNGLDTTASFKYYMISS